MSSNVAISIKNLSKKYQIYDRPQDRLKQSLWRGRKKFYHEFWALNNVWFDIKKGETVGIIGRNGSGKSTLLQIIAGTLTPTAGEVQVNGRVSALLELGSGFNPEFTGRENVYMNGAILGLSKEEMDCRFEDIISFADIGDFIDQPVKTYSSGMFVRLAFSVAISVDPDVLIVDEALSVGDGRFQLKCFERIKALKEAGTTILLVSHDLQSIRQFCDVVALFDQGVLLEVGVPNEVVNHYTKLLYSSKEHELIEVQNEENCNGVQGVNSNGEQEYRYGTRNGVIKYIEILDNQLKPVRAITTCDEVFIRMIVTAKKIIEKPIYAITVKTIKGLEVYGTNSYFQDIPFQGLNQGDSVEIIFRQKFNLMPGNYYISFGFVELKKENIIPLDRRYDAIELQILPERQDRSIGIVNLKSQINICLAKLEEKEIVPLFDHSESIQTNHKKTNKQITINDSCLSPEECEILKEPWYHNFIPLGYPTTQREGIYCPNQESKQNHIFDMIKLSIAICNDMGLKQPSGVELFCADGFYSNYAIQAGAAQIVGFDIDDKELRKAELITKILGNSENVKFYNSDVFDIDNSYNFAICAGGLYHIANPEGLLRVLREKVKGPLVIQTVYSLANNNEDYFESPAPGWTWGCRFSYKHLLLILERSGWKVLYKNLNELKGNERLEDRGSAYVLCVPN